MTALHPLVLVALAAVVAGVVLSAFAIARLVRLSRQPELARVPIVERDAVTFAQPGPAELAVEGPFLATRFRGLGFALADEHGTPIRLDRLWWRTSNSGFTRTRLSLYRCDIPRSGTYTVRVTGMNPRTDYGSCDVVFVRPVGAGAAVTIVSLLASVGLVGGGIATASALLFGQPNAEPEAQQAVPRSTRVVVLESRGGRAFSSDPSRLRAPLEIVWPVLRMHVRVPDDWVVRKLSSTELDLRDSRTPSTFLVGRVTPMPAGPTFEDYLAAHVTHVREQLELGQIDGYATKPFGLVPGVVTLEPRDGGEGRTINWTGFQPAEVGSLSVTLLAGAADDDFGRDEPLLGAILDSISFE